MTGGRLVRVQAQKHTTVNYYKQVSARTLCMCCPSTFDLTCVTMWQASRAGEGFGNRSSARFLHETASFVGPGKYSPDPAGPPRPSGYGGGGHSGKLRSTGPRFLKTVTSAAPGPGKYTPRHTLTDARNERLEPR